MIQVSAEMAVELLRRAVSLKGKSYVYVNNNGKDASAENWDSSEDACQYLHDDDKPGCIVGHALVDIGVDKAALREYNSHGIYTLPATFNGNFALTRGAYIVFARAQLHQDMGRTWGEALELAEGAAQRYTSDMVDKLIARGMSV